MLTSPDFKELLKIFEKYKIRYLIVGGYAVMRNARRDHLSPTIKTVILQSLGPRPVFGIDVNVFTPPAPAT